MNPQDRGLGFLIIKLVAYIHIEAHLEQWLLTNVDKKVISYQYLQLGCNIEGCVLPVSKYKVGEEDQTLKSFHSSKSALPISKLNEAQHHRLVFTLHQMFWFSNDEKTDKTSK